MNRFQCRRVRSDALAKKIRSLTADHPAVSGRIGDIANHRKLHSRIGSKRLEHHRERLGEQTVTGEDRHPLAINLVIGRLPPTKIVVVHGWKVIVHERIRMDHFDPQSEAPERHRVGTERSRRAEQEQRPESLARQAETVAHGLGDPSLTGRRSRPRICKRLSERLLERPYQLLQLLARGLLRRDRSRRSGHSASVSMG